MRYNLVRASEGDNSNLTVVHDGEMYVADETHTNWEAILRGVLANDESVIPLFDVSQTIARRFERLSERVTVANGRVYFDGEETNNALTQQIMRFVDEGVEDFQPLVNFFEKVQNNPSTNSREQLYRWLADRDFAITLDGNFLAYKGVKKSDEEGVFLSVHAGHAIADGVEYDDAKIPNRVGSIVEMPRTEVQDDPTVGCHTGLHAGTYEYASTFVYDGALLLVEINPRDVVSVPRDSSDQKVRVCRYSVVDVLENNARLTNALYLPETDADEEVDEDDDTDYCNSCGEEIPDWIGECDCEDEEDEDEDEEPAPDPYQTNEWAFKGPVDYVEPKADNSHPAIKTYLADTDQRNRWDIYDEAPWNQ